ncbi:MAG TPA: GIY-YIG nuclease family protein [Alphaproteobacteria bacterium]|nr:GIY-YIG nuclease family protein [Alphaproteobacteria bacterium]
MLTKEDILKEIQKWAKENGGNSPSEKTLREKVGIPKWDWIAYWPKITDMQREAELIPNDFDNTKYSNQDLCKKFIKLMREKGKWPSRDEMDFERRHNPKFPASATFYDKFGKVRGLALTILGYVKDKKGYDDVVEICNPILEKFEQNELSEKYSPEGGRGYVYLLKTTLKNATAYKIGKTKDLARRIKQLRQPSNREELIHSIETDDIDGVEKYWHDRFEIKRLYSSEPQDEWFDLNTSDVKAFKRWKRIV